MQSNEHNNPFPPSTFSARGAFHLTSAASSDWKCDARRSKNGSLSLCLEKIIQRCWIMMGLQYRFSFITLGLFAAGCRRFDWGKNHDLIRNGRTSLSFSNTVDCRETDAKICRQRLRLTFDQRPKSPTYKLPSELPMLFVFIPCLKYQGLSVLYQGIKYMHLLSTFALFTSNWMSGV